MQNFEVVTEYREFDLSSGDRTILDTKRNYIYTIFHQDNSVIVCPKGRISAAQYGKYYKLKKTYIFEWEEPEYYE